MDLQQFKIIFVNDVAATEAGALTILKQFLSNISKYSPPGFVYYVFCSLAELKQYENNNIKIVSDIKGKKWLDRIKWDFFGLQNWSKKHHLKADLIISLQNTGCRYQKTKKQIVYIHESFSFIQDKKFSFFKKKERLIWFYRHIYKQMVRYSLRKDTFLVVQTETMRKAIIEQFKWPEDRIKVIRPSFKEIRVEKVNKINFNDNKFHIFYPATTFFYKNHELIIQALKYIKKTKREIYNNLLVHFTFKPEGARNLELVNLINKLEVNDAVKLEGQLPYERVLSLYKSCDLLVFPSYIESYGLPIREAALFGLPILASDIPVLREVIEAYQGVKFLDYQDAKVWGDAIEECYKTRQKFHSYYIEPTNGWKNFFKLINELLR